MLPILNTKYKYLYDPQFMPSKTDIFNHAYNYSASSPNPLDRDIPRKQKILWDWLGFCLLLGLGGICYLALKPPPQYFMVNDPQLSYPYIGVYVPSVLVALLSFLIPMAVILIFNVFLYWDKWDLYAGLFGVIVAYAITLLFTGFFWVFVGGLRPHFLTICNVDWARVTSTSQYYTSEICKNQDAITRDTFHGFPSGHASTAFAGATFLSAYIAAHLRLWRNGNVLKMLLILLPFVCAIWLTFSRLMDFHHSLLQLTVGIIIGIMAGLLSYRLLYRHGFLLGYGKWAHIPFLWYK